MASAHAPQMNLKKEMRHPRRSTFARDTETQRKTHREKENKNFFSVFCSLRLCVFRERTRERVAHSVFHLCSSVPHLWLNLLVLLIVSRAFAQPATQAATRPIANHQTVCLPETDPASPRKSKLTSEVPKSGDPDPKEILRYSLSNNKDHPDVSEAWWHGHRVRWIGEGNTMKWTDVRGSMVNDVLQVDRDNDGYYDGPDDMTIKWVDDDGDGRPDMEIVNINPSLAQKSPHAGASHYMIFIDDGHTGNLAYIDWDNFAFDNWRLTSFHPGLPKSNFSPGYNGNTTFLKQHDPAFLSEDPRYNWENPFLFFDFDNKGCTSMSIRLCDPPQHDRKTDRITYTHKINEAFVTYDLDDNAQLNNEFDYDMTLRFASPKGTGEAPDYSTHVHKHPNMKSPQWALPLYRYTNWRKIDELIYVGHDEAYDFLFKPKWEQCWFVFDEDNDDHRWERVELAYPPTDVYSTHRWKAGDRSGGLGQHTQADSLGDRGEWDTTNKGHGQLYIGKWDHKLHLYGAETGAWCVDYGAKYWGSWPVAGNSSPLQAPKVEEVVQYKDTDNNGFFDEITYDYTGNKHIDVKISLKDYGAGSDECELYDPAKLGWKGMHELFIKIANDNFQDAKMIYRAMWKKGMTNKELDDLALGASTWEKYDHGYWLKEKIFRRLDQLLADKSDAQQQLRKSHFTGDTAGFINVIDSLDPQPQPRP
jgi:hypothetical protein